MSTSNFERLDSRAFDKITGPAWASLRPHFELLHNLLIGVSPDVFGTLTTIYIKYTSPELGQQPFAVVWIKKASEIIVGLALPPEISSPELSGPPTGCKYAGLTGYFKLKESDCVPSSFSEWAAAAYEHTKAHSQA